MDAGRAENIGVVVLGEELREAIELERRGRREPLPRGVDARAARRVVSGAEASLRDRVDALAERELSEVRAVRGSDEHVVRVGVDEMEAVVARGGDPRHGFVNRAGGGACERARHERAARDARVVRRAVVAIGDPDEDARRVHPEPRAAGDVVARGDERHRARPEARRRGGAIEVLVAVGDDDERKAREDLGGDDDRAHGAILARVVDLGRTSFEVRRPRGAL